MMCLDIVKMGFDIGDAQKRVPTVGMLSRYISNCVSRRDALLRVPVVKLSCIANRGRGGTPNDKKNWP